MMPSTLLDTQWIETVLWSALWQSSAWLALGLALSAAWRHRPARAHSVLLAAMLAALATPVLSGVSRLAGWGVLPGVTQVMPIADLPAQLTGDDGLAPQLAPITTVHVVAGIWVCLSMLALTRLIVSATRGARLLRAARPVTDAELDTMARRAARRMGLADDARIVESDHVHCPVVWCWRRQPVLVLPAGAARAGTSSHDLVGVLCHELAHFRRRDHLSSLVGEIALCLMPWNPLAWTATRHLHTFSEHACDSWVLASGESPAGYAQALLDMVPQKRLVLAPAASNGRRGVVRRIESILRQPAREPRAGRGWLCMLIALVAATMTGAATAHRRPATIEVFTPTGETAQLVGPDVITIPGELDLGVTTPGQTATREMLLCNRSETSHAVLAATAECGCTVVELTPGTIGPGECMPVKVSMTAPTEAGHAKHKLVTFYIQGQDPLELPVRLIASEPLE